MYIYIYKYICIYIHVKRCNHVLVQGHTVPHSTAFCPLVDPSDVVNSSLRVLTLCLAAIVVPCEQLCVCYLRYPFVLYLTINYWYL